MSSWGLRTAECLAAGALDEALVRASLVAAGCASGPVGPGVGALEVLVVVTRRRRCGHLLHAQLESRRRRRRRHDGKGRQAHGHQQYRRRRGAGHMACLLLIIIKVRM